MYARGHLPATSDSLRILSIQYALAVIGARSQALLLYEKVENKPQASSSVVRRRGQSSAIFDLFKQDQLSV